jgi:hypothetical protein
LWLEISKIYGNNEESVSGSLIMNKLIERWAPLWGTFDKIRNSCSIVEKCENTE